MGKTIRYLIFLFAAFAAFHAASPGICPAEEAVETGFEIREFEVTGNTLFKAARVSEAVKPFTGGDKRSADVEKARDALEKLYHDAGYPTVMVNIPEQTIKEGVVRLQVIESRIGQARVTGNRYFTMDKIKKALPSLSPGSIPDLAQVQKEIGRLNRSQDIKVEPVMTPGKAAGTVDVELKVEDRAPFHGYLELNNKASHNTKELRLNAMLRYDNLWQRDHSAAVQYQMAPQKPKEVEVLGATYALPSPWNAEHQLAFYGIWSDSTTATGDGFRVVGRGQIFGARYMIALPPYKLYSHSVTLGLDYKHSNQSVGFTNERGQTTHTAVSYAPLSCSYGSSLPDEWGGVTQFSLGVNMALRGLGSREEEFELKRFKATASYVFATAGVERTQKLPWGMGMLIKADGQKANQPLIDNEQYSAGGMDSVRGYRESEAAGDDAIHGTLEVALPDLAEKTFLGRRLQASPFVFYDRANLVIKEPLTGQKSGINLAGAGAGVKGLIMNNVEYTVDWAVALSPTDQTKRGDQRVNFKLRAFF